MIQKSKITIHCLYTVLLAVCVVSIAQEKDDQKVTFKQEGNKITISGEEKKQSSLPFFPSQDKTNDLKSVLATNTPIEVLLHHPIEFKFNISLPEAWEATDKVSAMDDAWSVSPAINYLRKPDGTWYIWGPAGHHTVFGNQVLVNWTKQDIQKRQYEQHIYIKSTGPQPDPEPDPDPTPDPDPQPQPNDPFTWKPEQVGKGLKVLIVEENDDRYSLPNETQNIFRSAKLREFLDKNCVVNPDGVPAWRVDDDDTQYTNSQSEWKKAMEVSKKPFGITVSNGKKWSTFEIDTKAAQSATLIDNADEVITELQKFTQ